MRKNNLIKKNIVRKIGEGYCFLCGKKIKESEKSGEHVFPKWLQKKFDLYNKEISFIRGKKYNYRNFKVDCCYKCNHDKLNPIETKIRRALNKGYEEFLKVDERDLFLWLNKIFYGIIYKEILVSRHKDKGVKFPFYIKSVKERFHNFLFLQECLGKHKFYDEYPFSCIILKTKKYKNIDKQCDYLDNIVGQIVSMRMDDIGIIATLQDNIILPKIKEQFLKKIKQPVSINDFRRAHFTVCKLIYEHGKTPTMMHIADDDKITTVLM